MRKINFLCLVAFLALFSSNLLAKDLKINVTAQGSPLGYSYIYVNGEIKTTANSMGVALIPLMFLNEGDIISASFVGFNSVKVIFDSNAASKKEITLNLTSDFTLDEVVVKTDLGKFYKKFQQRELLGRIKSQTVCFTMQRNE